MDSACTACLSTDVMLENVKDPRSRFNYRDMIKDFMEHELPPSLPRLCNECASQLYKATTFKEQVARSFIILKEIHRKQLSKAGRTLDLKKDFASQTESNPEFSHTEYKEALMRIDKLTIQNKNLLRLVKRLQKDTINSADSALSVSVSSQDMLDSPEGTEQASSPKTERRTDPNEALNCIKILDVRVMSEEFRVSSQRETVTGYPIVTSTHSLRDQTVGLENVTEINKAGNDCMGVSETGIPEVATEVIIKQVKTPEFESEDDDTCVISDDDPIWEDLEMDLSKESGMKREAIDIDTEDWQGREISVTPVTDDLIPDLQTIADLSDSEHCNVSDAEPAIASEIEAAEKDEDEMLLILESDIPERGTQTTPKKNLREYCMKSPVVILTDIMKTNDTLETPKKTVKRRSRRSKSQVEIEGPSRKRETTTEGKRCRTFSEYQIERETTNPKVCRSRSRSKSQIPEDSLLIEKETANKTEGLRRRRRSKSQSAKKQTDCENCPHCIFMKTKFPNGYKSARWEKSAGSQRSISKEYVQKDNASPKGKFGRKRRKYTTESTIEDKRCRSLSEYQTERESTNPEECRSRSRSKSLIPKDSLLVEKETANKTENLRRTRRSKSLVDTEGTLRKKKTAAESRRNRRLSEYPTERDTTNPHPWRLRSRSKSQKPKDSLLMEKETANKTEDLRRTRRSKSLVDTEGPSRKKEATAESRRNRRLSEYPTETDTTNPHPWRLRSRSKSLIPDNITASKTETLKYKTKSKVAQSELNCSHCKESFDNHEALKKHIFDVVGADAKMEGVSVYELDFGDGVPEPISGELQTKDDYLFVVEVCDENNEVEKEQQTVFNCNHCEKTYKSEKRLRNHVLNVVLKDCHKSIDDLLQK